MLKLPYYLNLIIKQNYLAWSVGDVPQIGTKFVTGSLNGYVPFFFQSGEIGGLM